MRDSLANSGEASICLFLGDASYAKVGPFQPYPLVRAESQIILHILAVPPPNTYRTLM